MKMKNFRHIAVVLILITLAGCNGLSPERNNTEPPAPPEKTVKALTLTESARPSLLEYIGTVDAEETVTLSFKNGGTLKSVTVKKGDAVQAGALLAQQDSADYALTLEATTAQAAVQTAQLRKAEDALAYSEKQYARLKALHEAQAVSDSELEAVALDLEVQKQNVSAARQGLLQTQTQIKLGENALADTRLLSPISGYVVDAPFSAGELVGDGVPVVILRSGQELVRVSVSQKDLPALSLGMKAEVEVDGLLSPGTVSNIAQVPNPQTRSYMVEVALSSGKYPLGSVARVHLLGPDKTGVLIPVESLQSSDTPYVYVVQDGVVVKKEVALHQVEGAWVFVTGITSGDQLITEGMKRVQPGDRVKTTKGGN